MLCVRQVHLWLRTSGCESTHSIGMVWTYVCCVWGRFACDRRPASARAHASSAWNAHVGCFKLEAVGRASSPAVLFQRLTQKCNSGIPGACNALVGERTKNCSSILFFGVWEALWGGLTPAFVKRVISNPELLTLAYCILRWFCDNKRFT